MENRRLGPLSVFPIGLGCMPMSPDFGYNPAAATPEESQATLGRALELGVNLLDTADVYGPFSNERIIGEFIASSGARDRIVLATKVGYIHETQTSYTKCATPEYIKKSIDGSLSRLQTDYVDLYQLHRVDPNVPLEETWGAMAEVVAAGKARWIGLSEVRAQQIATAHAIHPVTSVQSEFSLWTRDIVAEVMPICAQLGIGLLPFSPLGRGFLAGRFSSFDDVPANDFRRALPRFQQDELRANLAIVGAVRAVAERLGATAAQVALAWVLSKGEMIVPIPGTKRLNYLADNLGCVSVELSAADVAELDALPAPQGSRY